MLSKGCIVKIVGPKSANDIGNLSEVLEIKPHPYDSSDAEKYGKVVLVYDRIGSREKWVIPSDLEFVREKK